RMSASVDISRLNMPAGGPNPRCVPGAEPLHLKIHGGFRLLKTTGPFPGLVTREGAALGQPLRWMVPDLLRVRGGLRREVRERAWESLVVGAHAVRRDKAFRDESEFGVDHIVGRPAAIREPGRAPDIDGEDVRQQETGESADLRRVV